VRLSDERAKLWDKNLKELAAHAAWQTDGCNVAGLQRLEIKRREFPNKVQFLRAGEWVLAGFGPNNYSHKTESSAGHLEGRGPY